jgi:hypothetical protein
MEHVQHKHQVTHKGHTHRHVVPDEVKVPLACVKLDGETSWIAQRFRRAALMDHSGEAHYDGRLHARRTQEVGAREVRHVVRDLRAQCVRRIKCKAHAWGVASLDGEAMPPPAHVGF